jgi:hypothetical protein
VKRWLTFAGMILGVGGGIALLVAAYTVAPSPPGPAELVIQLVLIAVLGSVGGAVGFVVGWLADLAFRKRGRSVR